MGIYLLPVEHLVSFPLTVKAVLLVQLEEEICSSTLQELHGFVAEGQILVGT
jgi:hypothetical protein